MSLRGRWRFWGLLVGVGVLVAGLTASSASALACVQNSGLWANCYHGPGSGNDEAKAIAISPSGATVFVTGASNGVSSGLDYATEAIDASTGAKLWVSRFNGTANGDDQACCVAVSPDGSTVYVTGKSETASDGYDFITIALNAGTGAKLWVSRYNGPGNGDDEPVGLAVSPDGSSVYVTGSSYGGATTGSDYATVSLNSSTGARRWVARYDGPGHGADTPSAITVLPNGSEVLVTGSSAGSTTGMDYATIAYDPSRGAKLWVARYNSGAANTDTAADIAASPDSSQVFVTGTIPNGSSEQASTIAYNASTGTSSWIKHFTGGPGGSVVALALAVAPDGTKVYVDANAPNTPEVIAYNASTGARVWSTGRAGPARVTAFTVSPDGANLFLTGEDTNADMVAVGQLSAATGAVLGGDYVWEGPLINLAFATVLSPNSDELYTTGVTEPASQYEYATVKWTVISP